MQETKVADEALIQDNDGKEQSAQQSTIHVVPTINYKSKKKKKKRSKEGSASSTDRVERSLDAALDTLSLDVNSSSLPVPQKSDKMLKFMMTLPNSESCPCYK